MEHRYFILSMNFGTPIVMNKPGFRRPDDLVSEQYVPYEREHFKEKMHSNGDGRPYLPSNAIHKTLALASRYSTLKPPKGFKVWRGLIEDCLLILGNAPLECNAKQIVPWETNVGQEGRMGKKVMVTTVRPMILTPISAATKILVVDQRLSNEALEDICDLGGRIIGFMSARKLGYGRCSSITLQPISKEALD